MPIMLGQELHFEEEGPQFRYLHLSRTLQFPKICPPFLRNFFIKGALQGWNYLTVNSLYCLKQFTELQMTSVYTCAKWKAWGIGTLSSFLFYLNRNFLLSSFSKSKRRSLCPNIPRHTLNPFSLARFCVSSFLYPTGLNSERRPTKELTLKQLVTATSPVKSTPESDSLPQLTFPLVVLSHNNVHHFLFRKEI